MLVAFPATLSGGASSTELFYNGGCFARLGPMDRVFQGWVEFYLSLHFCGPTRVGPGLEKDPPCECTVEGVAKGTLGESAGMQSGMPKTIPLGGWIPLLYRGRLGGPRGGSWTLPLQCLNVLCEVRDEPHSWPRSSSVTTPGWKLG